MTQYFIDPSLHPELFGWFFALVVFLLVLDLGVINRKAHVISFREAMGWSTFWISLALIFNFWIYLRFGKEAGLTFFTGYLVEQSLSIDNLFVFVLVFQTFKIPATLQHRVLFWGIMGALIMRAVCIFLGVEALQRFEWLTYIFGAILIFSGVKSLLASGGGNETDADPRSGSVARFVQRFVPVTDKFNDNHFFMKIDGKRHATPLFLALVVIELSDVIFAIDSIPAVLAITVDPYIVYTSNIFAILGLRSIYFALAHVVDLFHHLKYALSFILVFVGVKLLLAHVYKIPVGIALGVIVCAITIAIVSSLLMKEKAE